DRPPVAIIAAKTTRTVRPESPCPKASSMFSALYFSRGTAVIQPRGWHNFLHRRHDDASQGAKSRRAGCRAVDDGARSGDPCPGHFCSPCVLSNKRPSSHLPDRHGLEWSRVRIPPSGAVAAVDGYGLG